MNTTSLKKSEKSRGIVAFANNTDTVNYVEIASRTLSVASKILDLPYHIISTNTSYHNLRFDINSDKFVQWNNFDRYSVYDLSPFDETLVIDADYLILDTNLKKIFEIEWDYLLQRESVALTQDWPNCMGPTSLPFIWATVFAFRKTPKAKLFFDLVRRIQNNYGYYISLYNIRERNYRNDYAFAIADYIVNGYCIEKKSIPGTMLTVDQVINSIQILDNTVVVKDTNKSYVLPVMNMHIMSKLYLQSDNFKELVASL